MGGQGSGRFPRKETGTHLGHSDKYRDDRAAAEKATTKASRTVTDTSEYGTPQPKASKTWNPIVSAWWRALGASQLAQIAQPADWMYAWVAADLLQYMYDVSGFQAGLMQNWVAMADRLHAPHFERVELPDAGEAPVDEDDAEADASISDIQSRFKVVQ
jgi:hypothetical protein